MKEYYSNINYGQIVKIRENGWLIRKEKRIIYGKPDLEAIETTDIENFNGINREIRKISKENKVLLKAQLEIDMCHNSNSILLGFHK
ncbi:MAG: hypothetical protein QW260_06820 [Thermoproteota archaeon]|nr:hypothetical protein [Candidatus Rehaiarchaeum fermentans]